MKREESIDDIPREYTDKELLDRCLDKMSYYQKAYMDLRVEAATVLSLVVFDSGVGYLKDNTQDEISKLYRKTSSSLIMNKEAEKLIEWEALQEFPKISWTEYHRNNWIAGAKSGYDLSTKEWEGIVYKLEAELDQIKSTLHANVTIEEGEIGKGFSREFVKDFADEVRCYWVGIGEGKYVWYDQVHNSVSNQDIKTMDEILDEYLNSQK